MLASSTHDAKRGEDVRARLVLLSEMPDRWGAAVASWSEIAARHGRPDGPTEYLAWQTLVGAWPISADRAWEYLRKSVREAKLHTRWTNPDPSYEGALEAWLRGLLADPDLTTSLAAFVADLEPAAHATSLSQTLLRFTAPGIPDTYAGTELWSHVLVDPDNRRPIDYAQRAALLERARAASAVDAWTAATGSPAEVGGSAEAGDPAGAGLAKLFLVHRALELRARLPDAFVADYRPLETDGGKADRVVAFARGGAVVSVAPRLLVSVLRDGWGDTRLALPEGTWRNVLDGREHAGQAALEDLLVDFPVALLERGA
jgi:(1->4)-alpha-D-glucan 1-alpha-D-glucosylmutase